MLKKKKTNYVILVILAFFALSTGCTSTMRNTQLEKVAKDWALVIRASQVIPVYPLTEDLQPGDVLLVSTPIEEQVKIYKQKGFLPLDQHMVRLYSKSFSKFYNSRYGIDESAIPPKMWQELAGQQHHWQNAPHAAFPSYNFSVDSGSGLNLAIPVQGVPFALGLMNSGKASGSVTIADAYTFGLDIYRLESMVRKWALQNRKLLRSYEPQNGKYHFLRVVSRVYVTGKVNVTINNDEVKSAGVAAGNDRPVDLILSEKGSSSNNYTKGVGKINALLAADSLPGAKVKIAMATSRSVTLNEEFAKPLVIGYVGFDMPILQGGRVGAPISTLAQLMGIRTLAARSVEKSSIYRNAALAHMYNDLQSIDSEEARIILAKLDALDQMLPTTYPFTLYRFYPDGIKRDAKIVAGARVKGQGFRAVIDYLDYANGTVNVLKNYQKIKTNPQLNQDIKSARAAFNDINNRLDQNPTLIEAIDFVFLGI